MKGNVKIINKSSQINQQITKDLNNLSKDTYKEFIRITPKDTGNARSKTRLQADVIKADYPYAERLDNGWSKQAPEGMIKPITKWVEERIKQIFRRI